MATSHEKHTYVNDDIELPVIDISDPNQQTADELVSAAATYGFIFIKSTGLKLSPEMVQKTFDHAREFFHSPIEEKRTVPMQLDNKGWTSMNEEVLDPASQKKGDPKEAFNIGDFKNGKATQPLSPTLEAAESHFGVFYNECRNLCLEILRLFALGLRIESDEGGEEWFSSRHDPSLGPTGTILRLLHFYLPLSYHKYPPTRRSDAEKSIRAGAHSDYGSLTLLFRLPNQPGLEILTPSGQWSPVPVSPPSTLEDPMPPILINIGDLLSYWTGGLLKSTVHRVVFPADHSKDAEERYSIAFFCHPFSQTKLVSVPSEMVKERVRKNGEISNPAVGAAPKDRALTAAEHLHGRLAASYGWETGEQQPVAA